MKDVLRNPPSIILRILCLLFILIWTHCASAGQALRDNLNDGDGSKTIQVTNPKNVNPDMTSPQVDDKDWLQGGIFNEPNYQQLIKDYPNLAKFSDQSDQPTTNATLLSLQKIYFNNVFVRIGVEFLCELIIFTVGGTLVLTIINAFRQRSKDITAWGRFKDNATLAAFFSVFLSFIITAVQFLSSELIIVSFVVGTVGFLRNRNRNKKADL